MDVVELTRKLVDIPSVTGEESNVAAFVADHLRSIGAQVTTEEVEPGRPNVFGVFGTRSRVTLSTHLDTVPSFIPSSEDGLWVYGRGSCDAKGILASMLFAAEALFEEGVRDFGILAVVGEEQGSAGALHAGKQSTESEYLINGEPTENKLAIGTKGALRLVVRATGQSAHSAYPELGDHAIDKLLDALGGIRALRLPVNPFLGETTVNIGTIEGGSAPNVIPEHAEARLLVRLVSDADTIVDTVREAAGPDVEVIETLRIEPMLMEEVGGFETTVVRYTTDIPLLCPAWGKPLLLGPGTIHVAHTDHERVSKNELRRAVGIYQALVKRLLT